MRGLVAAVLFAVAACGLAAVQTFAYYGWGGVLLFVLTLAALSLFIVVDSNRTARR